MLLYKRYLLGRISSYFLVVTTILICLIWFTRAVSFIKYITENGISISAFLYLFIMILPWLLLLILPISLFIAVLVSYGRMNASNEITTLKNSGLDKFSISKPAIKIAIYLSLFCYLISLYLMPMANKNLRMARNDFQHNYANIMISSGIFESLNNLTIYVSDRDENNNLSGILLYDNYNKDSSITLTARKGDLVKENGSLLMRLRDGSLQKYNFANKNSEILKFDSYVINLSKNKESDNTHVWKASERYIHELINPDTEGLHPKQFERFRVEIHQRFTYPLFSLILTLIACSYILKGEFNRRGNFGNNMKAIIVACIFISITMASYDLMEKSKNYTILLYANLAFFFFFCLRSLSQNKIK
jgi:lipopolysaccharide export system permease protein